MLAQADQLVAGQPQVALEQKTTDSCQKEANCLLTLLEPVLSTHNGTVSASATMRICQKYRPK